MEYILSGISIVKFEPTDVWSTNRGRRPTQIRRSTGPCQIVWCYTNYRYKPYLSHRKVRLLTFCWNVKIANFDISTATREDCWFDVYNISSFICLCNYWFSTVDVQTHFWACPRPAAVETCQHVHSCLSGGTAVLKLVDLCVHTY